MKVQPRWESDDFGEESNLIWATTGQFEHHITGDIAGAWNYYCVTQHKQWLKERDGHSLRMQ